jgi:hypothetical protein
MSIWPFTSDDDLVKFANAFLSNRLETFNKDLAVCLTSNVRGEQAYFPSLFICIAFADLLSGLYAGTLQNQSLEELKQYAEKFMEAEYTSDPLRLNILYEFLRHKIAHLAYPYVVFDTDTKSTFKGQPRRLVTWIVDGSERIPAIEIVDLPTPRLLTTVTPWPVYCNCKIKVSIPSFQIDIVKSVSRYLEHLHSDQNAKEHFAKCMIDYFPR